ncbi:sugar phosphate isomerase/epimerase family protein [Oenococcus oeni]
MKYATRINSFKQSPYYKDQNLSTINVINLISQIDGITDIELNFPQAFEGSTIPKIKDAVKNAGLKVSGVALRYEHIFENGEFTNPDEKIRQKAIQMTKDAVDVCRQLGGSVTTIWTANDGFDYPFQINYNDAWDKTVDALKRVTTAYPDNKISFEYKPYEPRTFSLIEGISSTLLLEDEVGAKNLGVTLDFCHMLMKRENPAYSLALAARKHRLLGFHLNDGQGNTDDGLMLGTVHLLETLEFIYYAKKYHYDEVNYFDTFPIRENPIKECQQNIEMYKRLSNFIDDLGLDEIDSLINSQDGLSVQRKLLLNLLNNHDMSHN